MKNQQMIFSIKVCLVVFLVFIQSAWSQIPTDSRKKFILNELEGSIHGVNSQKMYNDFRDNLSELRSFLRDIYYEPERFYSHLSSSEYVFIKYRVIPIYCNFMPVTEKFQKEDYTFFEDLESDEFKPSLLSCLRNTGSSQGLEYLGKLYDKEPKDSMKQIILDTASELLLAKSELSEKPGDLKYNEVYNPNLAKIFYTRDQGPWSELIGDFDQRHKNLSAKILVQYPDNKRVQENFALLREKFVKAKALLHDKAKKTGALDNRFDNHHDNNKNAQLNSKTTPSRKMASERKPQGELEESLKTQKNEFGWFYFILAALSLVLFLYFKLKKE